MLCDELYNELCQLLTNFETGERPVDANDYYSLLVKIQNNWELVVHGQEHNKETLIIHRLRA